MQTKNTTEPKATRTTTRTPRARKPQSKKRNRHLRVRATPDLRLRIEQAAALDNRSMSSFVVAALERRLTEVGLPKPPTAEV